MKWTFGQEGSLSSTFLLANQAYLTDPLAQLRDRSLAQHPPVADDADLVADVLRLREAVRREQHAFAGVFAASCKAKGLAGQAGFGVSFTRHSLPAHTLVLAARPDAFRAVLASRPIGALGWSRL